MLPLLLRIFKTLHTYFTRPVKCWQRINIRRNIKDCAKTIYAKVISATEVLFAILQKQNKVHFKMHNRSYSLGSIVISRSTIFVLRFPGTSCKAFAAASRLLPFSLGFLGFHGNEVANFSHSPLTASYCFCAGVKRGEFGSYSAFRTYFNLQNTCLVSCCKNTNSPIFFSGPSIMRVT